MTFSALNEKYNNSLNQSDWHQHKNGNGWVYKDAKISDAVFIGELAIVWGGTIRGGTIRGGTIWGGTICGGTIEGGTIRGGMIEGGTWKVSPLFLMDSRGHGATNAKPGFLYIGCEQHSFEDWKKQFKDIATKHRLNKEELIEYKAIVDLFCKIGK